MSYFHQKKFNLIQHKLEEGGALPPQITNALKIINVNFSKYV